MHVAGSEERHQTNNSAFKLTEFLISLEFLLLLSCAMFVARNCISDHKIIFNERLLLSRTST